MTTAERIAEKRRILAEEKYRQIQSQSVPGGNQ